MSFIASVKKFFPQHLSPQMREFYASSTIFDLGAALTAIFEPMYLWSIGWKLPAIISLYLGGYVFYFLVAPLGASFARRRGYEHSFALSTPFFVLYLASLFAIQYHPFFAVPAAVSFGLFRLFYWPAARSIIARYSADGECGRTFSGMAALSLAAVAIGPIIGGFLVQQFGFAVLFIVSAVVILLSSVPMLMTTEHFDPHDLNYADAYKRLLRPVFRRRVLAQLGYGEEFISDIIWPVIILLIIPSYFGIGAIVTAAGVLIIIAVIAIGRFTDEHHNHPVVRVGVVMTCLAWVARIMAMSPFGVVFAQSFYRISRITISVPFWNIMGKQAREYSVMKSSLLYEMALVLGKIIAALAALSLLAFFPDQWWTVLVLAGVMALFYGFI